MYYEVVDTLAQAVDLPNDPKWFLATCTVDGPFASWSDNYLLGVTAKAVASIQEDAMLMSYTLTIADLKIRRVVSPL